MTRRLVALGTGCAAITAALCWIIQPAAQAPVTVRGPSAAAESLALATVEPSQGIHYPGMSVPGDAIAEILDELSAADPGSDAERLLVLRWTELAPGEAANWVGQLAPGAARDDLLRTVAVGWAAANIDAALDWLDRWPKGRERELLASAIGHEAVRCHPMEALLMAEELPPPLAGALRDRAVAEWAAQDAGGAMDFVSRFFAREDRLPLIATVVVSLAATGDGAQATRLLQELPPGELRDATLLRLVQEWAQSSPAEAAQWMADYPEVGTLQKPVIEALVAMWLQSSAGDIVAWIRRLPEERIRELAVNAVNEKLASREPAAPLTP